MLLRRYEPGDGTKILFCSISGQVYIEDGSPYSKWVQLDDGTYLVDKTTVLNDIEGKHEAIMLVQQGISSKEGDPKLTASVHESDRVKLQGSKVKIDKMWSRRLFNGLRKAFYIMAVVTMSITFYLVLFVFVWAWWHVWILP